MSDSRLLWVLIQVFQKPIAGALFLACVLPSGTPLQVIGAAVSLYVLFRASDRAAPAPTDGE